VPPIANPPKQFLKPPHARDDRFCRKITGRVGDRMPQFIKRHRVLPSGVGRRIRFPGSDLAPAPVLGNWHHCSCR
jgi:hypothetical protein